MYGKKKCMKCGKQASVKFTRIEKGQVFDIYLCADHAAEMSPYQKPKTPPLSDILEGLLKQENAQPMEAGQMVPIKPDLRCGNCGLPFSAYKKNLLLGCSECYDYFRDQIIPELRRFHGETRHYGRKPGGGIARPVPRGISHEAFEEESASLVPKVAVTAPAATDPAPRIEELTRVMKKAIAEENFTEAARCRDQIRILKAELEKQREAK